MTSVGAWLKASPLPRRDAEILLCDFLDLTRSHVLAHPEQQLSPMQEDALSARVSQAMAGTPLAYIIGEWEFWGVTLEVNEHTLIPRPDTELLVEVAAQQAPANGHLIDLGTGSGAIAIALAKERPDLSIVATDVSAPALALAQRNAENNGVDICFKLSNWFDDISDCYHVVVSNPPYIAEGDPHLPDLRFEPRTALVSGADGLDDLRRITGSAHQHLEPAGLLMLEHGFEQGTAIRSLLHEVEYQEIETHRDLGNNERVTIGRR